ncbi:MAG: pyruvoyl-dependent arginine decarboxylase [Candidatus Njordarchaeia archaeon]
MVSKTINISFKGEVAFMSFVYVPKKVYINAVSAEGETELNAFDNCLIKLGIGDVSLVKVTSILPNDIEITNKPVKLPNGANVPTIYTHIISNEKNKLIAAAIALGKTDGGPTLVAEFSGENIDAEGAEEEALKRLCNMAKARNLTIKSSEVYSADHIVENVGCVLAAVVEIE